MGILNITPDSFSDGGTYFNAVETAVARAGDMLSEGADIIDVGGESTRPGARGVSAQEELDRVLPVIKKLRQTFGSSIIISIDTNKAAVAEEALRSGAQMVNSLGGFAFDPSLAKVVAVHECPIVIYHIKGEPRTMQKGVIRYTNVVREISGFFERQMKIGAQAGIKKAQYILDPGIGFGKSVRHNLTIIKEFRKFSVFHLPLLIGVSRKSHLGVILQKKLGLATPPPAGERIEASLAETAVAVLGGARIVRTHDVLATKKFLAVLDEILC